MEAILACPLRIEAEQGRPRAWLVGTGEVEVLARDGTCLAFSGLLIHKGLL